MEMVMTNEATATVPVMDTGSLDAREAELRDQLKQSMISGDAATMIEARDELAKLPIQRRAYELAALRKELDSIDVRFDQNATDEAGLTDLKKQIAQPLEELLDRVAELGKELEKTNFALTLVYDQRRALQEARRTAKAKIKRITDEIEADIDGQTVKGFRGENGYEIT